MPNKKQNDVNKEVEAADVTVAMVEGLYRPKPVEEVQTIDDQLKSLQLKQLQKEVGEQEEKENSRMKARLQNAKNLEQARKNQNALQDNCPHVKQNGHPAIGGQRNHQHDYNFICLLCQKEFDQHTLPARLRIPGELVGGPQS